MTRPSDLSSIRILSEQLKNKAFSDALFFELQKHHQEFLGSEKLSRNLEKLRDSRSVVVATGQQAGLFGGPLLTLYKALSAIAHAKKYEEELGIPVVPIFWVQSEDHDLKEISSAVVVTPEGILEEISISEGGVPNRISISQLFLPANVLTALSILKEKFPRFADDVHLLLAKHYLPGKSYNGAFSGLLRELLSTEGLIVFDPQVMGSAINESRSQIMSIAFSKRKEIEALLKTSSEGLSDPVAIRNNSPLFFISSRDGERFRVEGDNAFKAIGGDLNFSASEIEDLIKSSPERFTTSALLRPILQDKIFRTIAYVGGDSELSYHRQIEEIYPIFGVNLPALVPRSKFRIIDRRASRLLGDLKLSSSDVALKDEPLFQLLRQRGVLAGKGVDEGRRMVAETMNPLFEKFESEFANVDQTLLGPLSKTRENIAKSFEQFFSRYEKAYILKNDILHTRIEKLRTGLFPKGQEQERLLSLPHLLLRAGPGVINQMTPLALKTERQDFIIEEGS